MDLSLILISLTMLLHVPWLAESYTFLKYMNHNHCFCPITLSLISDSGGGMDFCFMHKGLFLNIVCLLKQFPPYTIAFSTVCCMHLRAERCLCNYHYPFYHLFYASSERVHSSTPLGQLLLPKCRQHIFSTVSLNNNNCLLKILVLMILINK